MVSYGSVVVLTLKDDKVLILIVMDNGLLPQVKDDDCPFGGS